jgi:imidazolonepropionase-like amidohydrolase
MAICPWLPAKLLGIDREAGRVATGLLANLIGVVGDPLADPSVLSDPARIVLVIKVGIVVKDTRALSGA